MTTKISISLADETVEALDRFIAQRKFASRSSAIQSAIDQMTSGDLTDEYARAHREWAESGEEDVWGQTSGDGLV